MAFAVQVEHVVGTGVDVELTARRPDPRSARFFLRADERPSELSAAELLRLWTVKEALFKATPDNAEIVLLDYRLADAGAATGRAAGPGGEQLAYASALVPDGVLTVAVCLAGGPDDVAV
ncbi:MAG: 4'-phosphopantetheinyl transferase superfamily protein [Actinomycetota bacterium]|nr:4'-phosphopantetheinyl transferase superfamily protein [Actinomycetota bacterium]